MKTSQGIIAILAVLGLAGCGQSGMPTHPMSYYLKHPKAAAKVVAYCQKRWPENRPYKGLSTEQEANCNAAANAEAQIALYGSPDQKKHSPGVVVSGGTMSALDKALSGNS